MKIMITINISAITFFELTKLLTTSFAIWERSDIADSGVLTIPRSFPIATLAERVLGWRLLTFLQIELRVSAVENRFESGHFRYTGPRVELTIASKPVSKYCEMSSNKSRNDKIIFELKSIFSGTQPTSVKMLFSFKCNNQILGLIRERMEASDKMCSPVVTLRESVIHGMIIRKTKFLLLKWPFKMNAVKNVKIWRLFLFLVTCCSFNRSPQLIIDYFCILEQTTGHKGVTNVRSNQIDHEGSSFWKEILSSQGIVRIGPYLFHYSGDGIFQVQLRAEIGVETVLQQRKVLLTEVLNCENLFLWAIIFFRYKSLLDLKNIFYNSIYSRRNIGKLKFHFDIKKTHVWTNHRAPTLFVDTMVWDRGDLVRHKNKYYYLVVNFFFEDEDDTKCMREIVFCSVLTLLHKLMKHPAQCVLC